ncbi:hypothetical protein [Streptomyces sp. NPDC019539]|uniref:hypothetical protein n=1 Tax=Streptomyces sp. NPDC019539 TaxID=3365063 RepID=UPI00379FC175
MMKMPMGRMLASRMAASPISAAAWRSRGVALDEMIGFGGDRPWTDLSTCLQPFLNHPDDHSKDLSVEDCAAVLPRLEAVLEPWSREEPRDEGMERHIEDAQRLTAVQRICIEKKVDLLFG